MREDSDVAENMNFTSHDYTDNFMYNNVWDLNVDSLQSNEWRKALDISWFLFCFVCLLHTNIIFFILFLVCLFVFSYGFLLTIQIINTISAMSANVIQISVLPLFEWAYFPLKCYLLYVKIE